MSAGTVEQRSGRRPLPGSLWWLTAAVLLLFVAALGFAQARQALTDARRVQVGAEMALEEAKLRQRLAQQNRALLVAADGLQQQAGQLDVLPQAWGERKIHFRNQHLAREEVNALLQTTARVKGQVFLPEEFDLAVTTPVSGLFEMPDATPQRLQLSLRGAVLFRISER